MNILHTSIGVLLIVLSLFSVYKTFKIAKAPLKKISEAEGDSTIHGIVSPDQTILSPISRTPCVYCVYRTFGAGVERHKMHRVTDGTVQVMAGSGVKHSQFYLTDDSGKILVEGSALLYKDPEHSLGFEDGDISQAANIQEFKNSTGIGEGRDRRYEEDLILPGDNIYVHGSVRSESGQKIIHADSFSLKDMKKTFLSPMGLFSTVAIIGLGLYLLFN